MLVAWRSLDLFKIQGYICTLFKTAYNLLVKTSRTNEAVICQVVLCHPQYRPIILHLWLHRGILHWSCKISLIGSTLFYLALTGSYQRMTIIPLLTLSYWNPPINPQSSTVSNTFIRLTKQDIYMLGFPKDFGSCFSFWRKTWSKVLYGKTCPKGGSAQT